MQGSALRWVTFCAHRKLPKRRMRGGFRFPPLMTLSLKRHKRGVRAPLGLPPRERETGDQKRRFPRHRALIRSKFVSPANHTRRRAEREIDATTMRLRAARTAAAIKGQDFRHGRESTGNAVSGFLFGDFFKSEKVTRCRTESCILRPRCGDGIPASLVRAARDGAERSPYDTSIWSRYIYPFSAIWSFLP
jgi:hypothetical protein